MRYKHLSKLVKPNLPSGWQERANDLYLPHIYPVFLSRLNIDRRMTWKTLQTWAFSFISFGTIQLDADISKLRIGVVKEGFGHHNSEHDVDAIVRKSCEKIGEKTGAAVEEISIPMHRDGNFSFLYIFYRKWNYKTLP